MMEKQKPRIIKDAGSYPVYLNKYGNEVKTCENGLFDELSLILCHRRGYRQSGIARPRLRCPVWRRMGVG